MRITNTNYKKLSNSIAYNLYCTKKKIITVSICFAEINYWKMYELSSSLE